MAGGNTYRWKGNNIRNIDIGGCMCATMPRKDSHIMIPISIKQNCKYRIGITAKNGGGNNSLTVELCGPNNIYGKAVVKIPSSNFLEYWIDIINDSSKKTNLKISKTSNSSGTIIIKEIEYYRVIEDIEEPKKEDSAELLHQQEVCTIQNKIAEDFRKTESKNILATRNSSMAIIGGNGYRWRGKGIRSIHKDNITCIELATKDSSIMVPVSISSGGTYKISITALKNSSGNSTMIANFFGNKSFDGIPATININSAEMKDYFATITAPKFPSNLPIYLRVWRPTNASGKVCITFIQYNKLETPTIKSIAKIKTTTAKLENNKKKNRTNIPILLGDFNSMKFRPYNTRKNSSEQVIKVLVTKAEDVPKVSIITPTRDGVELLKKCYEAINKNTSYPNWEWIVGDSNSTDGSVEYIKGLQDVRIKLVERGTIEGSFSSINNELAQFASGEYYLFLNNDTEPQPFWLYEMMSKIVHNPNIGIVGAKLIYNADKIQHAGICFIPQGPANIGHNVLESFPRNFANYDRFYQAVTGACLLMRSEDFKKVGGFDPIYYFCYEDVDLCLKVRKQLGKKVLYASNAVVIHSESITQKKYKTAGVKQQEGIKIFKDRWMKHVEIDFVSFQRELERNIYKVEASFVTCINNLAQYRNYIVGSLFKGKSKKNYEIIPILNFGNKYSASQALNLGISKSRSNIVVLCHQDVVFYENWLDMLFERINEIELKHTKKWGLLGTAGITTKDNTYGVVHNIKGRLQWQSTKRAKFGEVQTIDEHCMILNKLSGLRFDENIFNGFHFYGPDICLLSLSKGFKNYGILCPIVHDSSSGSLVSGRAEFMRLLHALAKKWRRYFDFIRTPTSVIHAKTIKTFIKFKDVR